MYGNRAEAAGKGVGGGAMKEGVGRGSGGRDAGGVVEGGGRCPIVGRLNGKGGGDREALENVPVRLPPGPNGRSPPLGEEGR